MNWIFGKPPKTPVDRSSMKTPPVTPSTPEIGPKETPRMDTANEVRMRNEFGSFDCFMNAVVQVLWNTSPFRAELKKMIEDENDKRKLNNSMTSPGSYNIIDALYGLFLEFEYYDPNGTVPVNGEVLRKLMAKISKEFRPGHQADANEFLSGVLEQIHEIMDPKCDCEASSDNCCIAHRVFGQWFDQVHCDRCLAQGEPIFPPFPETSFFPETVSAYELIEKLKTEEPSPSRRGISRKLSYGEAIARCLGLQRERCPDPESSKLKECNTDRLVAVKHRFATSLPKALAISLVWTREDEEQSKVEEFLLCLQHKFKRTELYHRPQQEKDDAVYRMAGMIVFIYFAQDMGHYVTIFRRGEQYKLFDDTRIESLGNAWNDVVRWMVKERRRARPTLLLYELDLGKEKENGNENQQERDTQIDRGKYKKKYECRDNSKHGTDDDLPIDSNNDALIITKEVSQDEYRTDAKLTIEEHSTTSNCDRSRDGYKGVENGRDLPPRRSWTSWTSPDRDSEKESDISVSSLIDSGSTIIAHQREIEARIRSDISSKNDNNGNDDKRNDYGKNTCLLKPGDTPGMNRPEGGDVDDDWVRNGLSQQALQQLQQMPPGRTSKNILSERWLDDVAMELYEELEPDSGGASNGTNSHSHSHSPSYSNADDARKQRMLMIAQGKLKKDNTSEGKPKAQNERQSFLSLLDETRTSTRVPAKEVNIKLRNTEYDDDIIPPVQSLNIASNVGNNRSGSDQSDIIYASESPSRSPNRSKSASYSPVRSPTRINTSSSQSANTSKQRFIKLLDEIMKEREEKERHAEVEKEEVSPMKQQYNTISSGSSDNDVKTNAARRGSRAADGTLYVYSWGYDPTEDAIYSVILQPKQLQVRSKKNIQSVGELGLKIHCDGTGSVVVYDFSRYHRGSSGENEMLPAEACGKISLMDHLIAVNGSPLYAFSTNDVKSHLRKVSQPNADKQNECPMVELTFSSLSKHVAWFNCPHCEVQNVAERSILMRLVGHGGGVTDVLCENCLQVSRWDTRD